MANSSSQQAFRRTILQKADVPASSSEMLMAIADIPPNAYVARESHPGVELGYVLEGAGTLSVDGQPQLALGAGQSWKLAPDALHEFRAGPEGARVLVSWVVEKGREFASPAG